MKIKLEDRSKFDALLRNPPRKGDRHLWIYKAACRAKACGIEAEEAVQILQDVYTLGEATEQEDIVRTVEHVYNSEVDSTPRRRPIHRISCAEAEWQYRSAIALGDSLEPALRASGWEGEPETPRSEQWQRYIAALFTPDELVLGADGEVAKGAKPILRTASEWMLAEPQRFVVPQIHCGEARLTTESKPSLAAAACFEKRRHLIVEMDKFQDGWLRGGEPIPLSEQMNFHCFLSDWGKRKGYFELSTITMSGGKSLHGLYRLNPEVSEELVMTLYNLLEIHGADRACANVNRWTRAGGGVRDNGCIQHLIWARTRE